MRERLRIALTTTAVMMLMLMPIKSEATTDFDISLQMLRGCELGIQPMATWDQATKAGVAADPGQSYAMGYCLGVVGALIRHNEVFRQEKKFCLSDGVKGAQAALVVATFMRKYPNRMAGNFVDLALEAFEEAWPCH